MEHYARVNLLFRCLIRSVRFVGESLKKTKNKIDLGEGFTFSEKEKFILLSTIIEQK